MADAISKNSYVAFGQQAAYGSVQSSLITASYLPSTGEVFSPGQPVNARDGTGSVMQRADQVWKSVATTDFNLRFNLLSSPNWKAIFLACFGKRTDSGAGPFVRTYVVNDPPVDPTTADAGSVFYNRGLTLKHTLHDGTAEVKTYLSQDCCVNRFQLFYEANKPIEFAVSGTGQAFSESTIVSYTELAGSLFTWAHGGKSANAGIYISATNPPALNGVDWMPLKKATLTLENNLLYDVFMGPVAGQEIQLPPRLEYPKATIDIEGRFSGGASNVDAVDIVNHFINQTARNLRIKFWIDANNAIELLATGATAPCLVNAPKITPQGNGVVGFSAQYMILPVNIAEFSMIVTNLT